MSLFAYPLLLPYRVRAETYAGRAPRPYLELNQVHGKEILEVTLATPSLLEGDGMVTKERSLPLLIRHADCQVAIFYDPLHHTVGIAHAGWRGQVAGIYEAMVEKMCALFGSRPGELRVALAPSLGPTRSEFKNYLEELPPWMWRFEEEPLHFNLWKIAEEALLSLGILPKHLTLPESCSFLDERLFSYRRDRTEARNQTLVELL